MNRDPIFCPVCGAEVDPSEADGVLQCPACGEQFFLTRAELESESPADEPPPPDDELDGLRIRQVVHLRRSNIRSRTYALVATLGFAIAAVKFILILHREMHGSAPGTWLKIYSAAIALCITGALIFARKTAQLHREIKSDHAKASDPEIPPSFDELGDGSQHARHLEDM